jgi:hypothetical protein
MKEEIIEKVSEVIKTLNFNIDSETGKEALIESIKEITPLIKWYFIADKITKLLTLILIFGGLYICLKIIYRTMDRIHKKKN